MRSLIGPCPFGGPCMLLILLVVLSLNEVNGGNVVKTYKSRRSSSSLQKMYTGQFPLYIAGLFPMSHNVTKGRVGRGVLPAVEQAIHDINMNQSVLRDYVLHIDWNDTKCDTGQGMKVFFDMMKYLPKKIVLFGDVCTSVTDPVAKASKRWNVVQLSYGDTHPMYAKANFPNLFRIVPSEGEFNAPRIELMKTFNWTRVGTLFQNMPLYSLAHNLLLRELEVQNIEILASQSFNDGSDIHQALTKLKDNQVRIILGNFNETWARRIYCEAYHSNFYGTKYQWLIVAAYDPIWWKVGDTNCTLEELETALRGSLLMDVLPLSTSNEITISGRTASQYLDIYEVICMEQKSRFHGYAYDGIWAIALALNNVSNYYNNGSFRGSRDLLTTFNYHNKEWEAAILKSLEGTSFLGVTGPVQFRDNGRKGSVLIKQFQAYNKVNAEVKVGQYDSVTQIMNLTKYLDHIVWNGKYGPPKDRTIQIKEHTRINLTLFTVFTLFSTLGILFSIFFLVINIKFRNQRYIKMSSPYLNNLIIIGCIFTYMSIIIMGLDSRLTSVTAFPYVCTARAWVLMAGFSLAFGSMFSKTWRVHSIFTNVKLNKKVIKDTQLFIVVGVLLTIDFGIMSTWQFLDPFYRQTRNMSKYSDPNNDDVEIIPEMEYCKSDYMTLFMGCIYAYKGLLMMFGCFLAWETRHVSIPALNDSKYIGMSVYNSVMMCIIGAPLSHVLSDKQDISFVIISIFIIFCTTVTLCLVFLPKVIELKRNPKGTIEKRLRTTIKPAFASSLGGHPRRPSATSLYEHELKSAKQINSKYRKQIREIDNEIQALAKILGAEASEILHDVLHNLTLPKSDILYRKEDTDISSLYSMNSDEGHGEDNGAFIEMSPDKKKPPRISVPWHAAVTAGVLNSAKTILFSPDVQALKPRAEQEPLQQQQQQPQQQGQGQPQSPSANSPSEEPITVEEKPLPKIDEDSEATQRVGGLSGEALLDLYSQIRSRSVADLCEDAPDALADHRRRSSAQPTTQDEIWSIAQRDKRYIGGGGGGGVGPRRSSVIPAIGEEQMSLAIRRRGAPKKLKSPTLPKPGNLKLSHVETDNEIFFASTHDIPVDDISSSTSRIDHVLRLDPNHNRRAESTENLKASTAQPLKYRSYSVPKRLDNPLSEINLDVSLLPIFHKLLSERNSLDMAPLINGRGGVPGGEGQGPGRKGRKFMVSCPNILIKCDIVEYL